LLKVKGSSGSCADSTSLLLTVNPLPQLTLSAIPQVICAGQQATLMVTGALNYTWLQTGQSGSVTVVSPTVQTSYAVQGADQNGCRNNANYSLFVEDCTGLEITEAENAFVVYPNPTSGKAWVRTIGDSQITLINLLGDELASVKCEKGQHELDLRNYAKGVYFVRSSSSRKVFRLILE
jgi:hypothetical protein